MLIVVALGIGSAAYNTASNILFMTLSLLLSSLILSGILSLVNFKKLKWRLDAPRHVIAGEEGLARIYLNNQKSAFPSLCLRFRTAHSMANSEEFLYLPGSIAAKQTTIVDWSFTGQRRGPCNLDLRGVESKFPFGFLSKTVGDSQIQSVMIWPAPIEYEFNPLANGKQSSLGDARSQIGQGSDLLKIRNYTPGDAPRQIHWKASARMNRLMVREHAAEGQSGYHLALDTDLDIWNEVQFEAMCSLAFTLARDLFHRNRLRSAQILGDELIEMRSLRDLHTFFDDLSLLERAQKQSGNARSLPLQNEINLRPSGDHGVSIYLDGIRTGETK